MINAATQAFSTVKGFTISFLSAPLAIIVNVIQDVQDFIGGFNASLIALLSTVMLLFTIRGQFLKNKMQKLLNKEKELQIRKTFEDFNNKKNDTKRS